MSELKLNFLGVYSNKFEESFRFYTEALGLKVKHSKPVWAAFATGDMKFELFGTDKNVSRTNADQEPVFIGLESKNIEDSLKWIKSKGTTIVEELASHSWGVDFYINDPDGNLIQIAEYRKS